MKKTISGILIICSLLSFQFVNAQSFKAEVGSLQNVDIGTPKFITDDGCFIFLDKVDNSLFLTVYDKNHKPLYIHKKLIFQDQKKIESAVNIMWMSGYTMNTSRGVSYGGDMYQKSKSIYFNLFTFKKAFLIEIDFQHGTVVSETEVERTGIGNLIYNETKTKFASLVFQHSPKTETEFMLKIYNINGQLIDDFKIDKSKAFFSSSACFLFQNDEIYVVSAESGYQDHARDFKFFKCDLKTRKLSYGEIVIDKQNGFGSIERVSDNTTDNSLIISWKYWYKKGNEYKRMISRVDKSTLVNTTNKELANNKMVQLSKLDKKYKLKIPELINIVSDSKGNNTALFFKHDYSLAEASAFGLSNFNNKVEELTASIYKFDVKTDYEDFIRNIILLNGETKNYVFLNTIPDNFNLKLEDKPKKIRTLLGQKPIVIEVDEYGNTKEYYVFGNPSDEDESTYIEFRGAYYDKPSNTLIAKMFTESYAGKSKPVWIKLK